MFVFRTRTTNSDQQRACTGGWHRHRSNAWRPWCTLAYDSFHFISFFLRNANYFFLSILLFKRLRMFRDCNVFAQLLRDKSNKKQDIHFSPKNPLIDVECRHANRHKREWFWSHSVTQWHSTSCRLFLSTAPFQIGGFFFVSLPIANSVTVMARFSRQCWLARSSTVSKLSMHSPKNRYMNRICSAYLWWLTNFHQQHSRLALELAFQCNHCLMYVWEYFLLLLSQKTHQRSCFILVQIASVVVGWEWRYVSRSRYHRLEKIFAIYQQHIISINSIDGGIGHCRARFT